MSSSFNTAEIDSIVDNLTTSFLDNLDYGLIIQDKSFIHLLISLHPSDLYDKIIAKLEMSLKCSRVNCKNRAITLPCGHKVCKKCTSSRCPKCSEIFSVNSISICDKITCLSCFKSLSSKSFDLNTCAHSCLKCCYRRHVKEAKTCKICIKDITGRPNEIKCDMCNAYFLYHEFFELQCSHLVCEKCTNIIKNSGKCEVCNRMLVMEDYYGIRTKDQFCCEGCENILNFEAVEYTKCCGKGMCKQCFGVEALHRGCRGGE